MIIMRNLDRWKDRFLKFQESAFDDFLVNKFLKCQDLILH